MQPVKEQPDNTHANLNFHHLMSRAEPMQEAAAATGVEKEEGAAERATAATATAMVVPTATFKEAGFRGRAWGFTPGCRTGD